MTEARRTSDRPAKDVVGWDVASAWWEGSLLRFEKAMADLRSPLFYGLRMWASAMLALYVAFQLQLSSPYWAATTAIIVCQPQVGASLRKSRYRLIGTLTGATVSVILTALFPQDRILFFGALALWIAVCAVGSTLLSNFAAYGAALSGYTCAIVLSGVFDMAGGLQGDQLFMHALLRTTEIILGITSAGLVLALTDAGGAPKVLEAAIRDVTGSIMRGFMTTLAARGASQTDYQPVRRALARDVIALDPLIDQTIGESSEIRLHSPVLLHMEDGLISALVGWRTVDLHLRQPRREAETVDTQNVLDCLAPELLSLEQGGQALLQDAPRLEQLCAQSIRRLKALPVETPSGRLLADNTAEVLTGFMRTIETLILLDHGRLPKTDLGRRRFHIPELLPAFLNGARAFITVVLVCAVWIGTGWPGGSGALTFAIVAVTLLGPRAEAAYAGALAFSLGNILAIPLAAIMTFAILPAIPQNFVALALVLGMVIVPLGAKLRTVANPIQFGIYTSITVMSVTQIGLANPMVYSSISFYNSALSLVGGCAAAALSFRLVPPFSAAFRARRLVAASRRDLSALTAGAPIRDWTGRMQARALALPDQASATERSLLLAILAAGNEIAHLRATTVALGERDALSAVLSAFTRRDETGAREALVRLDSRLAASEANDDRRSTIMRARASAMALIDSIDRHDGLLSNGAAR